MTSEVSDAMISAGIDAVDDVERVRKEIEAMRVRMAAKVHRGDFRMGGGSTDGKTWKTWGGEKIMVAVNPDGYAAMELIDRLAALRTPADEGKG